MSTFRNPVGPQSSKVYWRRRLIVALGLVAVIVIVILIVVQPRGAGTPTPGQTPGASNTPAANPTDAATAAAGEPCDPSKVTVEPTTDATSYDAGANPVLSFTLKSSATVSCTFSGGTDVQNWVITSGDEVIWNSKDCQTDNTPAVTTLLPGVPKQGPNLTWDRTRSSADTCTTERDQVVAGGASYHLEVTVNGVKSAKTAQFLLN